MFQLSSLFRFDWHHLYFFKEGSNWVLTDVPNSFQKPFACQLVCSRASPWTTTEIIFQNSTIHILNQTRECIVGDLGKPRGCSGAKARTFTYFWVRSKLTFSQARENCHESSAKLFDLVDHKKETAEFLLRNMLPDHTFWIGWQFNPNQPFPGWLSEDNQRMNGYEILPQHPPGLERFAAISYEYNLNDSWTPPAVYVAKEQTETLHSVCYKIQNVAFF